ncbi:hypothetical protein BO79DRAFT_246548 [Aspergillus costaricaensis CBS 115574]|uniref:Uncharacterized protein n=1 Tax=Aspergillus costaricaensis CBS 115574 TaxID=1448317 RepID=A0ACD1I8K2_9EURO|nr:hypothetical protein BO79DRAFT_246548 [Aspergillus costaricaensis CBS 115574]RAK86906.1 hypothetical protein BO79DRAFT_246548 [Aspergillus costaricaensis CBS 115574]
MPATPLTRMSTATRDHAQDKADPILHQACRFDETSPHSEWTQTQLLPLLRSHLPHSLPLLRRIQHEIAHPSPTAVILTTFSGPASSSASSPVSPSASGESIPELVSNPGLVSVPGPRVPDTATPLAPDTAVPAVPSDPESFVPWLIAYVDLNAGRENQVMVYSSLERTASIPSTSTSTSPEPSSPGDTTGSDSGSNSNTSTIPITTLPPQHQPLLRTQLLSLLHHIKQHLLPPYLTTLSQSPSTQTQPQDHQLSPPPPTAFLFGNLHTGLFSTLLNTNTSYSLAQATSPADFIPGIKVHRFSQPAYVKYLLPREVICHQPQDKERGNLPPGFHFSDGCIPRKNLGLVRSRTVIPRSEETLAKLRSCAVYGDGDVTQTPVAWAFLGTDGSLATLHVEEEVRGLGLAGVVGREVMRRGIEEDEGLNDGWMHSNAAEDNLASRRVMEKLGGTVGWTIMFFSRKMS